MNTSSQKINSDIQMAQTDPLCFSDEYETSNTCLACDANENSKEESTDSYLSRELTENESVSIEKTKLIKSFLDAFEPYYLHRHRYYNESLDSNQSVSHYSPLNREIKNRNGTSNNPSDTDSITLTLDGNSTFYKDSIWKNKSLDDIDSYKFKPYIPNLNVLGRIREAYNNCTCKVCECISEKSSEKNVNISCDCYSCQNGEVSTSYREKLKSFNTDEDLYPTSQSLSKLNCKCDSCECEACVKYSDKHLSAIPRQSFKSSAIIVAAVGENVEGNLCDCSPCGCSECVGHGHETTSRLTHNVSTGMSATHQATCSCDICRNERCSQSMDGCRCDSHGVIVSKPINNYDIHRMSLFFTNPLISAFCRRIDTIAMVSALSTNLNQDLVKNNSHCRTCECTLCKPNDIKCMGHTRKPSRFEPLAKVIGKVNKLNADCVCSPCECQECKINRQFSLDIESKCEICKRLKRRKIESKQTTIVDFNITGPKVNFNCKDTCNCQPCECVFCQKINECCTNGKKSNESIYPVKKGKLLTPSVLNACDKPSDQPILAIFPTLPTNENPPLQETCVSRGQSAECLENIDSMNIKNVFLSKIIETDIEYCSNRKLDNPILNMESIENINRTKVDGSDFRCFHKCGMCNNTTVLTLNDFKMQRARIREENSSIMVDIAVQCDLYDKGISEIGLIPILNRSRLLTLRFNEIISQFKKRKNTNTEKTFFNSKVSSCNINDMIEIEINKDFCFIKSTNNQDHEIKNEEDSITKTTLLENRSFFAMRTEHDERWKLNNVDPTKNGTHIENNIANYSSIYLDSNDCSEADKKVKIPVPVSKNQLNLPKELFNEENYEKYKDLIKEVALIMNTVQEMKSVLHEREISKTKEIKNIDPHT